MVAADPIFLNPIFYTNHITQNQHCKNDSSAPFKTHSKQKRRNKAFIPEYRVLQYEFQKIMNLYSGILI